MIPTVLTNYLEQGQDAPPDIHPFNLEKSHTTRTNHAQFTPYTSADMQKFQELYIRLKKVFEDLFEWIRLVVSFRF